MSINRGARAKNVYPNKEGLNGIILLLTFMFYTILGGGP